MDFTLRCNSLKCRIPLKHHAVVTTCSHIFCLPCSQALGLANSTRDTAAAGSRLCPACEAVLPNQDDVVVAPLDPAEDYKTSVLSGLSPSVVVDCAGRGLAFWSYQATQEIFYQEFLARSLTDKYTALSTQMDKVVHDANAEIGALREKLQSMHLEQKSLEEKNQELQKLCRERARNQAQLQKLYRSLKAQQLALGMEVAAEHDAESVVQAVGRGDSIGVPAPLQRHSRNGSAGSPASGGSGNNPRVWDSQTGRPGLNNARAVPSPVTPAGHRTRFPAPIYGNQVPNSMLGMIAPMHRASAGTHRQPLGDLDPNMYSSAGFGVRNGIRTGRQPERPIGRNGLGGGNIGGKRSPVVDGFHVR